MGVSHQTRVAFGQAEPVYYRAWRRMPRAGIGDSFSTSIKVLLTRLTSLSTFLFPPLRRRLLRLPWKLLLRAASSSLLILIIIKVLSRWQLTQEVLLLDLIINMSISHNGQKVSYFYEADIGNYHYGNNHPMKPHRIRMTDSIVRSYGLNSAMAEMVSSLTPESAQ